MFTGGTPCDLTSLERETEVLFKCAPGKNAAANVAAVAEPATCRYSLVFATPALCDSGTDAAKKKEPSDVRCRVVELNPKPGGPSSEEAEDPSSDPGSEEAEPGNAAREEL